MAGLSHWFRRLAATLIAVAICTVGSWAVPSSAMAASSAYLNCSLRYSTSVQVYDLGGWKSLRCGYTISANPLGMPYGVQYVRDLSGPICIYFGSTLAGCASTGKQAYIGNRSTAATIRTQPLGS